jgi:hypothetical protein
MTRESAQPPVESFIRFEQGMMDYLISNGHLSKDLRPLWEQRLRARLKMPPRLAFGLHVTAVRDCLEMAAEWNARERLAADRFLKAHGACTFDQMKRLLPKARGRARPTKPPNARRPAK